MNIKKMEKVEKWHYLKNNDYPKQNGKYLCFVKTETYYGSYDVLYWDGKNFWSDACVNEDIKMTKYVISWFHYCVEEETKTNTNIQL